MIYILLDETPQENLTIKGETFKYLIKVRRHGTGDIINLRFKSDIQKLCRYEIVALEARSVALREISSEIDEVKSPKELHIAWCVIDAKSVEKVLPSLSEIGVSRISFINCERSQKNFKLDLNRFERILEASMQQCGRSTYIAFDSYKSIAAFLAEYPDTKVFDFCENPLKDGADFKRVLIGCEGGFSKDERELLSKQDVFRLNTPMVLRSESAVVAVASKILL